jgi:hypothetical protein
VSAALWTELHDRDIGRTHRTHLHISLGGWNDHKGDAIGWDKVDAVLCDQRRTTNNEDDDPRSDSTQIRHSF